MISSNKKRLGWARDQEGLAIFFLNRSDLHKAQRGAANQECAAIYSRFEMLMECGDATVERDNEGIYIDSADAVRIDPETRELFQLPGIWPGGFTLDTASLPNLSNFNAVLRLNSGDRNSISSWILTGPILSVGDQTFLPSPPQFACLVAFKNWQALTDRSESDHLMLIHTLTEATNEGAFVDLDRMSSITPVMAEECVLDTQVNPDGSISLTPLPFGPEIERLIGSFVSTGDTRDGALTQYLEAIRQRLSHLDESSAEAIIRVGSHLILLDRTQAEQARNVAKYPVIPASEGENFRADPASWLADHCFQHSNVEFLPRVLGIGEWQGGYLGAAGEIGPSIDWFNKGPEPSSKDKSSKNESSDSSGKSDTESPAQPDNDEQEPKVPIIEKNDTELGWGLSELNKEDPDSIRILPKLGNYKREPFPHQKEAIQWLAKHAARCGKPEKWSTTQRFWGAGALLADDMGLGKTLSTLVFINEWYQAWKQQTGKVPPACLIVSPLSLVDNWKEEIIATYLDDNSPFSRVVIAIPDGELRSYYATKNGKDLITDDGNEMSQYGLKFGNDTDDCLDQPGTIVLTTYTTLRNYRFSFAGCNWGTVVFDEAQNIKNPNALQTIAAKSLKGFFRIALSGTPVENHLGDLWSLMDTVEPGALGSFAEFKETWIAPLRVDPSRMQELGLGLRNHLDSLILRRTKEESLKGLPNKFIKLVEVKMHSEQLALYDEILTIANSEPEEDSDNTARSNRWLASMWELRRVSLHPDLLGDAPLQRAESKSKSRNYFNKSAKLEWLLGKLDEIKGNNEKVLIFCVQKKLQEMLANHLEIIFGLKVPIINGDTKAVSSRHPNETRLGLISKFSKKEGFGVCILSPIAAGAGLNVTAANHVIHLERHWNPAKEDQATDRCYRIGQKKDVHVYLPILHHVDDDVVSFDVGLNQLITAKKNLAGSLGLIPVQQVKMADIMEVVIGSSSRRNTESAPLFLGHEEASKLAWDLFEALIAEIYSRNSDRVILSSKGRDHGADVAVLGYKGKHNLLIQVKTTRSKKLDSELAIREVEGAMRHYESALNVTFDQKLLHTNVTAVSRRTTKAAKLYHVTVLDAKWIKESLRSFEVRISDLITRNANRESV